MAVEPGMVGVEDQVKTFDELVRLAVAASWEGGDGNDSHAGTEADDVLDGKGGSDHLAGGAGNDILSGGSGQDTLSGGSGADLLEGGNDFDFASYADASSGLTVSLAAPAANTGEAAGDTYDSIQGIIGSAYHDRLTGNIDLNHLIGGGGDDTLEGGAGKDTLEGGIGNDTYIDPFDDTIIDTFGIDTVLTSRSYALNNGSIEHLIALDPSSTAAMALSGNGLNNTIIGTRGANILDGMGGADVLIGGLGDDTYIVDQSGDVIGEASNGGFDTLITSTSYSLASDWEIELLKFADPASKAAQNLSGSASSNVLLGTAGANVLKGYAGNDGLKGEAGNDRLYGGSGNDTLYGGAGVDRLYGEGGRDIFVFDSRPSKTNLDRIYSYKVKYDSVYLDNAIFTKLGKGTPTKPQKLKASMFALGNKAQDSSDRILYDKKSGALYYDKDGSGSAAKVKFATLDKNLKITAAEFFVI